VARERFDERDVVVVERTGRGGALDVERADPDLVAERRAQHRADALLADAGPGREPIVEQRRRGLDGLAARERGGDDAPRHALADLVDLDRGAAAGDRPPRGAEVVVVDLEVALVGVDRADDHVERLLERRPQRAPPIELEQR
jgi:hypothetical protein